MRHYEALFEISVQELRGLFKEGYLVIGPPRTVDQITEISRKVFDIRLSSDIIKSIGKTNRYLIILRNPEQDKQIEILTDNADLFNIARDRLEYQREPVGTFIRAECKSLDPESKHNIEQFIRGLNGYSGWEISLGDTYDSFVVISRIESIEKQEIEKVIERIRIFLDALSLIGETGFYIQHYSATEQPRMHPAVSFGMPEHLLKPIEQDAVKKAEALLKSKNEISIIVRGLNLARLDYCYPSRLDRLWATTEAVFSTEPESLLSSEEIETIRECAKQILSLRKDGKRLQEFDNALSNPNRLAKEGRNERIARKISELLKTNYDKTYQMIKKCSVIRGKHGHQIQGDWGGSIDEAAKYLIQILTEYLRILISEADQRENEQISGI